MRMRKKHYLLLLSNPLICFKFHIHRPVQRVFMREISLAASRSVSPPKQKHSQVSVTAAFGGWSIFRFYSESSLSQFSEMVISLFYSRKKHIGVFVAICILQLASKGKKGRRCCSQESYIFLTVIALTS